MSKANTTRGKVTEQMVCRWLRDNGYPGAERTVRTGYRVASRELADHADIDLCPGLVVQVKSLRPANAAERAVPRWLVETEAQRLTTGADRALLIVRREGTADVGEWWAWLPLRHLPGVQTDLVWPSSVPQRAAAGVIPVRLMVADAVWLLRRQGWGEPINEAPAGVA